jgi:hypothetical protein
MYRSPGVARAIVPAYPTQAKNAGPTPVRPRIFLDMQLPNIGEVREALACVVGDIDRELRLAVARVEVFLD